MSQIIRLRLGDSFDVLASMDTASVRAIITDPPYGLSFMGKDWDTLKAHDVRQPTDPDYPEAPGPFGRTKVRYNTGESYGENNVGAGQQEWHYQWLKECYRILKPGGMAKVFSATRTYHRVAAAMAQAGFQNLDIEAWAYGSGFPKSLDVSKAIDKHLGVMDQREVLDTKTWIQGGGTSYQLRMGDAREVETLITAPASDEAKRFDGWGTALKPSWEPFLVGRKPA